MSPRNAPLKSIAFALLLGCAVALAPPAGAVPPGVGEGGAPRIATVNWALAETLTALGAPPVAAAGAKAYRRWVAEPRLPGSTVDVGHRIEPNLTALAGVAPDLIVMSDFHASLARASLERIAPVEILTIYEPGGSPLENALAVARRLAGLSGRQPAFRALRARLDRALAGLSERAARSAEGDSVYVVQFRDAEHVRVYGANSLFQGVLERAGLENAWRGETNFWGFATAEFTRLDTPADHLIVVGPVPREAETMMRDSPTWRGLPVVRRGRVHRLDPVWAYGGVPSAIRFAGLLEGALDGRR